MKELLLQLIGPWEPTTIAIETVVDSYATTERFAVVLDFPWILSALFLAVFTYCLFRIGGAILSRH